MEELDFAGPWEVFAMANEVGEQTGRGAVHRVLLLAENVRPVTCAKGLRVLPDMACAEAPPLDILLIPGGIGTRREANNAALLAWVAAVAGNAAWVTSVCTGALVLAAAGLTEGRKVTSHWAFAETLRTRFPATEVIEKYRYIRDGRLVTAAGVSAGIDMALWLTGQLHGPDFARAVQRAMQYDPAPPYAALT
jgi:transcriptional regulator GlxA family with amidase domain